MIKLYSSIKPQILKRTLFKGTIMGLVGVSILFLSLFLPLSILKVCGLPLFLVSFMLIGGGMIPYKRLTKLEKQPHEIECNDLELLFSKGGRAFFRLMLDKIQGIEFIETEEIYGIGIKLKKSSEGCLTLLTTHAHFATHTTTMKNHVPELDLFLPHFTYRSFHHLQEYISLGLPEEDHAF